MKAQNLAELFGLQAPSNDDPIELRNLTASEFCEAVVNSYEFRKYILDGIRFAILPPQILGRIIDHAWGKAPDRVEHTGRDGAPIVTEIRRVIVSVDAIDEEDTLTPTSPVITH